MPHIFKHWRQPDSEIEADSIDLHNRNYLDPIIASILADRSVTGATEIDNFLFPDLQGLPDPFSMLGMEKATDLILQALQDDRPVAVFGDYDVDGVTATAVLIQFFKTIDTQATYYHPNREKDGYGLRRSAIDRIGEATSVLPLLITVDCGVSDWQAIEYAKEQGMDVIITDHHLPPDRLPKADVILNPLQEGCSFPCKNMAGVGLAFYLAMAIRKKLRDKGFWKEKSEPNLKNMLDLVALGSVADMVPLQGVNRTLVKAGLNIIKQKLGNPGLLELIKICRVDHRFVSAEDIGYRLAPRINAAGRIADASGATDLFTCDDLSQSRSLCKELDSLNEQRKDLVELIGVQAMEKAKEQVEDGCPGLVLHDPDWHPGVIGIVAARVTDKFHRPALVLSGAPVAKGSARTIPAVDIYEGLSRCEEFFQAFGGHRQAAGVSILVEDIEKFTKLFNQVLGQMTTEKDLQRELILDAIIDPEIIDDQFYGHYKLLEPFGNANPEPVFMSKNPCRLRNVKVIGKKSDHLKFSLKGKSGRLSGIGFGFGHLAEQLTYQDAIIAFAIKPDNYNGRRGLQLQLLDVDIQGES